MWTFVSLRPEISGLHVDRQDTMLRLIPTKFPNLRYLELATELITPVVSIISLLGWGLEFIQSLLKISEKLCK